MRTPTLIAVLALSLGALAQFPTITSTFDESEQRCIGSCTGANTWYTQTVSACMNPKTGTRQECYCGRESYTENIKACFTECLGADATGAITELNTICGTTGNGSASPPSNPSDGTPSSDANAANTNTAKPTGGSLGGSIPASENKPDGAGRVGVAIGAVVGAVVLGVAAL